MRERLRIVLTYVTWPALFGSCLILTHVGITSGHPFLYFNFAYICLGSSIFVIERLMPFERRWLENDGQMVPDLVTRFSVNLPPSYGWFSCCMALCTSQVKLAGYFGPHNGQCFSRY